MASRGVPAFFFFFMPSSSPHYQHPRFKLFCEACAWTRTQCPTLTLSALRTFLIVAEGGRATCISYDDIASRAGLDYIQAAHHIEQLSTGRAGHEGLELITRREEANRRYRTVNLTEKGSDLVRHFVPPELDVRSKEGSTVQEAKLNEALRGGPLPAIHFAIDALPGIALGTFTVLLEIARNEARFGFEGMPAKTIAEQLGISNFPRHLSMLSDGLKGRDGFRLVECITSPEDRRIKLPRLTAKGHRVVSQIAALVCGEALIVPRRAKPEKAIELASADMISSLDDADFDPAFDVDDPDETLKVTK
jgi:DNA-binding MarR family transcriptional regulator